MIFRSEARIDELDAAARPQSLLVTEGVQPTATERRKSLFAPSETIRIAMSLHVIGPPRHAAILRDLFWTLYSKFAAVLEGHRIVYEVSRWISSVGRHRRCLADGSVGISRTIPALGPGSRFQFSRSGNRCNKRYAQRVRPS
jgi:hypothetical protein